MKKLALLILGVLLGMLLCYLYLKPDNMAEEPEIIKPKGVITSKEAKTLDAAFNSRHELISDSIVKRPDNRSSWYSLEDMRNYLDYAENQAKELGYTMDGVRIYLGAHANEGDQVGYTTMFLIPTGTKNLEEGSSSPLPTLKGSGDISEGDGLNNGENGEPPSANYPQ
ncbi:hypothetical protein [Mangrovimonas spongiae]|uniref:Uncharacterized protein n=1 Tax=Mangrovimonas spongiae TaxID=2494697 RepID=A0A428K1A6_9FLAO|nr:hypothetical protein [Mangrovimonas spongiae]RSK40230.1 hypothetical protein EJA19_04425 [Mangrovimonas spongiae]